MPATQSASNPFAKTFAGVLRFAARVSEAGRNRRVLHGLATLDDHMLRDIGLTRYDVEAALIEPAMTDGTLVLAQRVRVQSRSEPAPAREAQAWVKRMPSAEDRRAA